MFKRRYVPSVVQIATLIVVLATDASAAWRAAGDVVGVERQPNGVVIALSSGARAAILFTSPDVVRVRLAPKGKFEPDFSYAVEQRPRASVDVRVRTEGEQSVLQTANTRLVIQHRPFSLVVLDAQGDVIVEDDRTRAYAFDSETGAVETSKKRPPTELYYGFGEKPLPMSRHGQTMVMWNYDTYAYDRNTDPTYKSVPFFIALHRGRAYGIFFDNTHRTYFDMGKTDPARYTFGAPGGELNYYVFTGGRERAPRNILRDYTELTGRTPLPPIWALGFQQSRWSYYPEARVRDIARTFREKRIPCDVIYLDIDYMNGYRVFTWNRERFPDPAKLARDLRQQGFRLVLIIDPGIKVDENYDIYLQGRAGGYFPRAADGSEFHARVWPGTCAFPDFTDPKARAWFGSLYRQHLDEGIAGFWNDMNEPATFLPDDLAEPRIAHHPGKTFPLDVRHAGEGILPDTHRRYHNVYGMQMARATFEGVKKLRPDLRPFVLTRAAYAGVQRYSAVWTGDNVSTWDHLALTIPMLANLGVSGVPFAGADVGGFADYPVPTGELYARWLQAAVFTPFLRAHSTGSPTRHQEPWAFGPDFERINRATIELRYIFLPYIYSVFREHEETGAPVMRPLWFDYPTDARTYLIEDQFLLGRDILVAPVVREGERQRRVYFPAGETWIDWWTGARFPGGREAVIEAPLDRLPFFVRAGAALAIQAPAPNTDAAQQTPLALTVAIGSGESKIYQDRGDGYAYERGEFRRTTVRTEEDATRLRITLVHEGAYRARDFSALQMVGLNAPPREVRIDGRSVERTTFDAQTGRLRVELPATAREIILLR